MSVVHHLAESIRGAMLAASTTAAVGYSTVMEWIPTDVGKIASTLGVVLTSVLIFVHISRELRERRHAVLRDELLRRQLADTDGS